MEFKYFRHAVNVQLARLLKHGVFKVAYPTGPNGEHLDQLYNLYLDSFPPGTNEIFRKQREYECSCCRSFIRAVGGMVAIIDGKLETIWDVKIPKEPGFQPVADALAAYVRTLPIDNVFTHFQAQVGQEKSFETIVNGDKKDVHTWNHFSAMLPSNLVMKDDGKHRSEKRSSFDVFYRSMREITVDALNDVADLIATKGIYKHAELKGPLTVFFNEKIAFDKLSDDRAKELFAWNSSVVLPGSISRLGNTSFGTLLYDLSEGKPLDTAVAAYESMVAPENYKRTTAPVTQKQILAAKEKMAELGLTSALARRFATLNDITVNNILFVDRSAKPKLSGANPFDDLAATVSSKLKVSDKIDEVSIEHFIAEVLPRVESIEVLVENHHAANFVSLIAPDDATAGDIFKWNNKFSWSYVGDLADSSMRKAVQDKGGRVDGVFRFTHQWNYDKRNASLMDLHVFMPGNSTSPENVRCHDEYGNEERVGWNNRNHRKSGGTQDVDYTSAAPEGYVPVENITFPDLKRMPEGRYVCKIHNWQHRPPTQGGFKAEIEFAGNIFEYEYDRPLKNKEWVTVAEVTLKKGQFNIKHHLPTGQVIATNWGLPSQTFHKVNVLMLSPNYWDGQAAGNKHFFFMLQGAVNDGKARGFYNEFLREDLNAHRKVFEMVGSKMRFEGKEANEQLSGLGFSSTQKNSVTLRLKGQITRIIKVNFNA